MLSLLLVLALYFLVDEGDKNDDGLLLLKFLLVVL